MTCLIKIITRKQRLYFESSQPSESKTFLVSTSKYGLGQIEGSNCTPLGGHQVYKKIGSNAVIGSIFKGRVLTGEIYHPKRDKEKFQNESLILSRIIWLSGIEKGFNSQTGVGALEGRNVDTKTRYIYIHGTNHEHLIGKRVSNGCIHMMGDDLIWLFNRIKVGDKVWIQ